VPTAARPGQTIVVPSGKVHTLPERSFGCAQSCLLLAIAAAIVLVAIGCFGLWAIADYIMINVLDWPYRGELPGLAPLAAGALLALGSANRSL
jgi:hypothetical protein